jgi:Ca2+-binding EF-hand superfamily protein
MLLLAGSQHEPLGTAISGDAIMRSNWLGFSAAIVLACGRLAAQEPGELFSRLDANKDGFVTSDEVQENNRGLFERLVRNADQDGDKKLSKEEFQAGLRPDETPKPPLAGGPGFPGRGGDGGKGDPREFFARIDANKDGKLSKDELPDRLRENFGRLDANGDGALNQEEFAQGGRQFGKRPPSQPMPGMPPRLRPDQLEAKFADADKNKDGKIATDEMRDESERATLTRFAEQLNPGGDGSLTKQQYLRVLTLSIGNPAERFEFADRNRDGKLSPNEVQDRDREALARVARDANPTGDGAVTREQYIRVMSRVLGEDNPPPAGRNPNPGALADRESFERLFDRTDSNSDGKLTKDEVPEERRGMRMLLEREGDSLTKEQFVRGMLAMAQSDGQPPRPEGFPPRRPDGQPGPQPGGGLFGMLDTDRDGQLSNVEIVGAGVALLRLDKNGDGKLTPDEAFVGPVGPPGRSGEGRPGDRRPGERRPGDGPPPGVRPGEGRPGPGRGNFGPEAFRDRLKEADANKDGKVSKEEAPPMLKERFDWADANSDGFLDEAEMRRMFEQMREGGPRRGGGDQPRPGKAGDPQ